MTTPSRPWNRSLEAEVTMIADRCEAASPGPWQAWCEGRDGLRGTSIIKTGAGDDIEVSPAGGDDRDGLNRLLSRQLPMGVSEAFEYDVDGRLFRHVDRRRIVRTQSYDLLGRLVSQKLLESVTAGGQSLTVRLRSYRDSPDGLRLVSVTEQDANGHQVTSALDALQRELTRVEARGFAQETYYDAKTKRAARDRKGYVTEYQYDAADRVIQQIDRELDGKATYTQSFTYDDGGASGQLKQTAVDRRGIPTAGELDGLGRVERATRGSGPGGTR